MKVPEAKAGYTAQQRLSRTWMEIREGGLSGLVDDALAGVVRMQPKRVDDD
jgi:hypothetical protein